MTGDFRFRRGLVVLLAAGISLTLAGPALGAAAKEKGTHNFQPGVDISSWYWSKQSNQEVTTPPGVALPPPAPPVSQRVTVPNTQRPDTIPVALHQGEPERMSAIKFDVTDRGVTEGSEITKFLVTIHEGTDRNEHPQVRADAAKISACRITESLVPGENEEFADAPKFADADCVEGKRKAAPAAAPGETADPTTWTFDLSPLAGPWGKNPFDNQGVMLVPVAAEGGPQDSWHVNLKVPALDDATTADVDEYEQTKGRAVLELEFVPGEPLDPGTTGGGSSGGTTTPTASGGVGTTSVGGIPTTTGGSPVVGSTDLAGTGDIPGAETGVETAPATQAGLASPVDGEPRLPAYVWLAIPVGLAALSAVRSAVLEPTGGPRPDGVIAAIRRRNAQRRGARVQSDDLFGRLTGAFRRRTGDAKKTISNLARSVRRR